MNIDWHENYKDYIFHKSYIESQGYHCEFYPMGNSPDMRALVITKVGKDNYSIQSVLPCLTIDKYGGPFYDLVQPIFERLSSELRKVGKENK